MDEDDDWERLPDDDDEDEVEHVDAPEEEEDDEDPSEDEASEEEDEDEEDDEDEEEEEDEDEEAEADGMLNGGVAEPIAEGASRRAASEAELTLFLECSAPLSYCSTHAVLKPGVTVQIGLDKSTKLQAVFTRFVEFCNEQVPAFQIDVSELEFLHTDLLNGLDTAEGAALMKNDRIYVRPEQNAQRQSDQEFQRMQRESDRDFLVALRQFLPTNPQNPKLRGNVLLDCRHEDQRDAHHSNRKMGELWAHAAILKQRCPAWARLMKPMQQNSHDSVVLKQSLQNKTEEEEDAMMMRIETIEQHAARQAAQPQDAPADASAANQIEDDDEGGVPPPAATAITRTWLLSLPVSPAVAMLVLEFLHTNRVVPLGYEAFVQSCRTKPHKNKMTGPVPPFAQRKWPSKGDPTVSFGVALATLRAALAADLDRLALMAEVACSQQVSPGTVVQAVQACEELGTRRELSILRKAAMEVLFRERPVAAYRASGNHNQQIYTQPGFRRALESSPVSLVPTLLTGTLEVLQTGVAFKKKRDWRTAAYPLFEEFDKEDAKLRERERKKRRRERRHVDDGEDVDTDHSSSAPLHQQLEATQMARMHGHAKLVADHRGRGSRKSSRRRSS